MTIAVLSDIHGNSWALNRVMDDLIKRKPDYVFNLGDIFYGPLDPKGTWEIIESLDIIHVLGNEDRILIEDLNKEHNNQTLKYCTDQLDTDILYWLASQPFSYSFESSLFLCHGTPKSDSDYLIEKVDQNMILVKKNHEISEMVKGLHENIILCGHSHKPRIVDIGNKILINPGSVGLQAYSDSTPSEHVVENYCPNAQYCIIHLSNHTLKVEQISHSYNFEKSAAFALSNGRDDWAKWLMTGRV